MAIFDHYHRWKELHQPIILIENEIVLGQITYKCVNDGCKAVEVRAIEGREVWVEDSEGISIRDGMAFMGEGARPVKEK